MVLGVSMMVLACSTATPGEEPPPGGDDAAPDATVEAALPCDPAVKKCEIGEACAKDGDCANLNCVGGVCSPGSCEDKKQNQGEQGIDCGGPCKACDGAPCVAPTDCTSGSCVGGMCGPSAGKTCGVGLPVACEIGEPCSQDKDCKSDVCTANKCVAVTPDAHTDGRRNAGETDIDCGGTTGAPACKAGKDCAVNGDCEGVCNPAKKCEAPTCTDGIKDGDETDVDCGGSCVTKCAPTKKCAVPADCVEGVCDALVCAAPTANDGVKNGNETDVDCGSSTVGTDTGAPGCVAGLTCINAVDCLSTGCNHAKKCAFARSCTMRNGGTTCGTGDADVAGNANEDCCASAEVPAYNLEGWSNATAFRLDKYQVTSGRIRRFLDAVGGNVQGWVQANRENILAPNQLPAALDKFLPTGFTQANHPTDTCNPSGGPAVPCNYGALNQVSGNRYNNEPGGLNGFGCYIGPGAYGSRTFYLTDDERVFSGEAQHVVSRERVEQKSMTCVTYFILAAFCAWDGGRLETLDEYYAAYGGNGSGNGMSNGRRFPWGSDVASRAIGFASSGSHVVGPTNNYGYTPPADAVNGQYSVFNVNLSAQQRADLLVRVERANLQWNYASAFVNDYRAPLQGRARAALAEAMVNQADDQSVAVAPPGRYPAGAGRYGHRDLAGNMMEITAQAGTATTGNRPWTRNGSFETSHFDANSMIGHNYSGGFAVLTKYGRTGGRCARPIAVYPATALPEAP
ncbi:MAG: hypothetical protein KF819_06915 [Labilithrix sp.]|nr:hypothetical protein [Labilithrix sp.]